MTLDDFSTGFDTLLSSYLNTAGFGASSSKADINLDEYEKSQFLTKAQEEYAISLYTGKNSYGEGFEATEELRRYLAPLVEEADLTPITTTNGMPLGVSSSSKFFSLPDGSNNKPAVWFITYESVTISDGNCEGHTTQDVFPVRQDEYHKIKRNPFRGANSRRALRLDLSDNVVEIVSKYTVTKYYIRYLRKLKPIILIDLGTENSIEESTEASGCELHEALHQKILELAVRMAIQSRGYKINENK